MDIRPQYKLLDHNHYFSRYMAQINLGGPHIHATSQQSAGEYKTHRQKPGHGLGSRRLVSYFSFMDYSWNNTREHDLNYEVFT